MKVIVIHDCIDSFEEEYEFETEESFAVTFFKYLAQTDIAKEKKKTFKEKLKEKMDENKL